MGENRWLKRVWNDKLMGWTVRPIPKGRRKEDSNVSKVIKLPHCGDKNFM
jgi:hypothetical protein